MTVYINGVDQVSHVIWKDASERALNDDNRVDTLDWTELDLTAFTSSRAKVAILKMRLKPDTVGDGAKAYIRVRKSGTDPTYYPELQVTKELTTTLAEHFAHVIVALSSDKKIDYYIYVGTAWQIDTDIYVLGYIE